jgi:uncharacterized protein (TIGR00369 family)
VENSRVAGVAPSLNDYLAQLETGDAELPPVARLVGLEPLSIGDGHAGFALDVDPTKHANPMGTLHGGILCDLSDAAMGMAYASGLGPGETFTTLELKINFLKPVWSGRLTATARVVKAGHTVGLVECDVLDAQERLVARASSTCMTLRGDHAAGR